MSWVVGLSACDVCYLTGIVATGSTEMNESTMNRDIRDLSNSDVEWHGTPEGLYAALATERAKRIAKADAATAIPELINALSDANKFVAAHVLLTSLSGVEYSAFPSWNSLQVDIKADGQIIIDSEQRHELVRRWQRWYQTNPHPSTLPAR